MSLVLITDNVTSHNSAYVHRRLGRRLGLHGAAARRSATWPLALVGLGASSHTCGTLYEVTLSEVRIWGYDVPRTIRDLHYHARE